MRVLQAHKFYWYRDGASNYALFLSDLLKQNGHEVIPFAMQDEKNLESPYSRFFVSKSELQNPEQVSFLNKLKYTGRMFYSFDAKKKIKQLLKEEVQKDRKDTVVDIATFGEKGQIMADAEGNRARVFPDGRIEEIE